MEHPPDFFAVIPFRSSARAHANIQSLRQIFSRLSLELPEKLLSTLLAMLPDPDMALNNLERFLNQPGYAQRLPEFLQYDGRPLEMLLTLLSTSQFFADTLILEPDAVDLTLQPPRRTPSTDELTARLKTEIDLAPDDAATLRAFRRFRQLETLRVGINDILRERPLEEVTRELARIADASVKVALMVALRTMTRKYGTPHVSTDQPARFAGFAFGKLGGDELNYSSDIDLMFIYDKEGSTQNRRGTSLPNHEFFGRVVTDVIRLLSAHTDRGFAYRVDLRLRPDGQNGPLARSLASTLSYYDVRGRTWERQALIKVRPIAGDQELGLEFIRAIEPFVYRKYFSFSEINEVKSLKRRMEHRTRQAGLESTDVKNGIGGIRDIEYTVQFLQLVNGGDIPAVRQRNTLLAIEALEIAGCLTPEETFRLSDGYRFLRKIEHRLQLLFDWQTHKLPTDTDELSKLARRMGYQQRSPIESPTPTAPNLFRGPLDELPVGPLLTTKTLLVEPLDLFLQDFQDKTTLNRAILDHLLHQTFSHDADGGAAPESDLLLDPNPQTPLVLEVLGKYPFRDVPAAFANLIRLSQEAVPFLSGRRCRHFLANIAPQLLQEIAKTPDPDETLNNLERVTASLGAKAVLYELFSFNPPSLRLYVDICANSPYLTAILTNNPGMIDELLDSLVLDQPRSQEDLQAELVALCRGALDLAPILHSFQDKEFLRVGVRDLVHKADIRQTTAELSFIAEALLNEVFEVAEQAVSKKYGSPPCRYAVVGLGKLGGREISYHSDLDIILLYEHAEADQDYRGTTSPQHYFTELAQHAIKILSKHGPLGRLYAVDMRLRPTGRNGNLVLPLCEFTRYYSTGAAQLWERQALTRARSVRADAEFRTRLQSVFLQAIQETYWSKESVQEILSMRDRLEMTASPRSLKRARGGLADVEFLVQLLLLKYVRTIPQILTPNLWDALDRLESTELLTPREADELREGYSFLRYVEARLRIVTDRPLTELPEDPAARQRLALRVHPGLSGEEGLARFDEEFARIMARNRNHLDSIARRERISTLR